MIDRTFPVDATPRVEISIQSGEVRLQPGNPGEIRVVADSKSDRPLTVEKRGGRVVVKAASGGWLGTDSVDVTAYVPEKAEATVSTVSADVRAATPLAQLEVSTASGDIDFGTVDHLEIKTASGDVNGEHVTNSVRVVTASGDVRIDSCSGKGSFSSASGDVELRQCRGGSMKASTASGDVSISMCQSSEVKCNSMSGSVSLGFQPGTHVDLDVNTLSGRVNLPSPPENRVETVRDVAVKARLVSGDVNLFVSD